MGLSDELKKAARRLSKTKVSFAISRNDLIERISDLLVGALGEQYKAVVGTLIGETTYVQHWQMEVEGHLYAMGQLLSKDTKGRFDKRKAVGEALAYVQRADMSTRKWAITHLQGMRYKYFVPKSVKPTAPEFDQAFSEFVESVDRVVQEVLG